VRPRIPDRDPGPRYARGTVRILSVSLLAASADRERLRRFYGDELGLPPSTGGGGAAVFRVGTTTIEFSPTPTGRPFYHFAFRVPRNRFDAARAWLAGRTELLPDSETGDVTFEFASCPRRAPPAGRSMRASSSASARSAWSARTRARWRLRWRHSGSSCGTAPSTRRDGSPSWAAATAC